MWEPFPLVILGASTACNKDIFTSSTFISVLVSHFIKNVKLLSIPVTGREGPQGCEMLNLLHFLDNPLTDGGKVVSVTRRPPLTPRNIPGIHFC
jgi:hypothetical protein